MYVVMGTNMRCRCSPILLRLVHQNSIRWLQRRTQIESKGSSLKRKIWHLKVCYPNLCILLYWVTYSEIRCRSMHSCNNFFCTYTGLPTATKRVTVHTKGTHVVVDIRQYVKNVHDLIMPDPNKGIRMNAFQWNQLKNKVNETNAHFSPPLNHSLFLRC